MPDRITRNIAVLAYPVAIFVVLPLLYLNTTLDPETLPRMEVLSVILLLYFAVFFFRAKQTVANLSFLKSIPVVCFFLYAGMVLWSLNRSINPGDGLFDALKVYLYLALFVATCLQFQANKESIGVIIKCINLAVLIFTLVGAWQLATQYSEALSFHSRFGIDLNLCSTLANKNVYSETLLLCLPFAVYGSLIFAGPWKGLALFNVPVSLLSIIVLVNIYVWLALLLCFVVAMLLLLTQGKRTESIGRKVAGPLFIACLLAVLVAGFLFVRVTGFSHLQQKAHYVLDYLHHPEGITRLDRKKDDNNIHERMVLIRNTLHMIKESSFTGVGLGNWKIYCAKYGPVSYTPHIRPDHPHNDYLCLLAESGFGALLFYLLYFAAALFCALKVFYKGSSAADKWLGLLLFCSILGCGIVSFFGFTKEKIMPMILLMTSSALAVTKYNGLQTASINSPVWLKRIIALFFILPLGATAFVAMQRLAGEVHLNRALKAQQLKQCPEVISEATLADSWFYPVDFSATPVCWYKGLAYFYSGHTDSALTCFTRATKFNPYHVEVLNDLGTCYELKQEHAQAIVYYEQAYRLNAPVVRKNLVAAYFNAGDLDKAFDIAVAKQFEEPIFLEELLQAKARRALVQQKDEGVKAFIAVGITKAGWLTGIFDASQRSGRSFEEVLLKEAEEHRASE